MKKRKKISILIVLIVMVLFFSGCFGSSWIITLKSDGSGTIMMEYRIDKQIIEMMQSMGTGESELPAGNEDFIDPEELNSMAASIGEGVRFVSARPKADSDNAYGYTAVFEFDDINMLTIDPMEVAPETGDEGGGNDTPFSFRFTPGRTAELIIVMDQDEGSEATAVVEPEVETEGEDDEMMAEMMKPYFQSMSFLVQVVIDGEIQDTNAHYRDENTVTLMDMDMGKIIDNDELFKRVMSSDNMDDEAMIQQLEQAGIRIESEEEVVVRFR